MSHESMTSPCGRSDILKKNVALYILICSGPAVPCRAMLCDDCTVLYCTLVRARVPRAVHHASVSPTCRRGGESDRDGCRGGERGRGRGRRSTTPAEAGRRRQRGHPQKAHAGAWVLCVPGLCMWCVCTSWVCVHDLNVHVHGLVARVH